jgi:hypothetical protein
LTGIVKEARFLQDARTEDPDAFKNNDNPLGINQSEEGEDEEDVSLNFFLLQL